MNTLLNMISIFGSFCVIFGVLYFLMSYTIGLIPIFKRVMFGKIELGDLVFPLISFIVIMTFIDFYRPY